jgi:hypothetical protein
MEDTTVQQTEDIFENVRACCKLIDVTLYLTPDIVKFMQATRGPSFDQLQGSSVYLKCMSLFEENEAKEDPDFGFAMAGDTALRFKAEELPTDFGLIQNISVIFGKGGKTDPNFVVKIMSDNSFFIIKEDGNFIALCQNRNDFALGFCLMARCIEKAAGQEGKHECFSHPMQDGRVNPKDVFLR